MKEMKYEAAIFDMDGTILDTIEDLKDAVNHSLEHFGLRGGFTAEETYMFFGSGAREAVIRALTAAAGGAAPDEADIGKVLAYYKPYYAAHCAVRTGPFPGIPELLAELRSRGIRTAVVSNKPDGAVRKLCGDYFPGCFDYAAGEIDGIRRKPAPDMVLRALEALGVPAGKTIYIGDTEVDIETAENSGLACLCLDWGFRTREQLTRSGAGQIVSTCEEMRRIICGEGEKNSCRTE